MKRLRILFCILAFLAIPALAESLTVAVAA